MFIRPTFRRRSVRLHSSSRPAVASHRLTRAVSEALEGRQLLSTSLIVAGTSGPDTLIITATGSDSGSYSLNGNPAIAFTGLADFTFNAGDGDDILRIVNPANSILAPTAAITFNGGGQSGDALENLGGAATSGSYTPGATPDAGTVSHTNGVLTQTINFTGLAPVSDTVADATFLVNGTAAGEHVNIVNGPVVSGFTTTEVNSSPDNTFELIRFAQKTSVTVDTLGGADTVLVDNSTAATGLTNLTVTTGAEAGDTISVGTEVLPGTLLLTTSAGSVTDSNGATPNISATSLGITAGTGIATAADPLETSVANLEATTTTGGISIANATAVNIGGVNSTLKGLTVVTSGNINFTANGSITLTDLDGLQTVTGGSASGNVSLQAIGAGANFASAVDHDAATAPKGNVAILAGGNISLGTTGLSYDNDVRASGSVTLSASGNVTVDGFSDVSADDFGDTPGGNLVINAGQNIAITSVFGNDASAGASGVNGSDVLLTTGIGGTFTLTSPSTFGDAVFSSTGDVTVAADRVVIASNAGISATSGIITIKSVTPGLPILVGSLFDSSPAVELSDTEMDRLNTPTVKIGDANFGGAILVTAPITAGTYSTLELVSPIYVSGPAPVQVTNLVVTDAVLSSRGYTLAPGTFKMDGAPSTLPFTATTLTLNASIGSNSIAVTASPTTTFNINGRNPTGAGTAPGDLMTVSGANPFLHITGVNGDSKDGNYTFSGAQNVNFTSIETLLPGPSVDLSITKTDGVVSAIPGTNVTYTITASNAGGVGVTGVTVADTFPSTLTNISWSAVATPGSSVTNASGTGNINELVNLAAGGSVVYTVNATIASSALGTLSNTATITTPANFTDPTPGNNSATDADTLTPQADLVVTKTGPAIAPIGGTVSYSISITNNGPSDATSVNLIDLVPAGTTFVSMTQDSGPAFSSSTPAVGGTGPVIETITSLVPGGAANFTLVVQLPNSTLGGTVISNTAVGSSGTTETVPANNSATVNSIAQNVLTVSDVTKTEGQSGVTAFTFVVSVSGSFAAPFQVAYSTHDQTALVVDNDYEPAIGTLTFLPGQTQQTVTVLVNGDKAVEPDETFTLDLGTVLGSNIFIGDGQGVGTIVNDDPPPPGIPGISVNDVSVTEGNSGTKNLTFTVKLSRSSGQTITVKYTTADGTGVGGVDYVKKSGTLTFLPGQTTKTVSIQVKGDKLREADETVLLVLSAPTHAFVSDPVGIGTIKNDDDTVPPPSKPAISVNDVLLTEGNSGTKLLTFTVKLNKTSTSAITVKYTTSDGTAKLSDNDYIASSGTITFAAGQLSKTVSVAIKGDKKIETDETVLLALSGPTNATISDPLGIGTIKNDD